jgi:hypothetical protein
VKLGTSTGAQTGALIVLLVWFASAAVSLAFGASSADSSAATGGTSSSAIDVPAITVVKSDSLARKPQKPMAQQIAEADSILRLQGGSRADDAQLFLSWDAPWGQKRARRERRPACADSTVEDTLYLCMTTGRASGEFDGFTAELMVRAVGTDTLGAWWHMQGKGGENPGAMRVEFAALQDWGAPQPFQQPGQGFVILEPSRSVAKVRLIFAVPNEPPVPIAAQPVYALARITLKHMPQRKLSGCSSPVVIEWTKATLAFGTRDEPTVARGERFVTFGGPYSLIDQFRGLKTQPWKPPPAAKK